MTGPLVVLGVLSAIGGFLNDPAWLPIVPTERSTRWLEPVTARRRSDSRAAAGGGRSAARRDAGRASPPWSRSWV